MPSAPTTLVVPQIKSANTTKAKNLNFFIVAPGYISLFGRPEPSNSTIISASYPSSTDEQIERPKEAHSSGLVRLGLRNVFNVQLDGAPAALPRQVLAHTGHRATGNNQYSESRKQYHCRLL